MGLLHAPSKTHASFDDVNLVSSAGLVPVMRLAERCGLPDLIGDHVQVADRLGVNAPVKIDDLDVVRLCRAKRCSWS